MTEQNQQVQQQTDGNKGNQTLPRVSQDQIIPGAVKQRHLQSSPTQKGDMYYGKDGNSFANLPIGGTGALLNVKAGVPAWVAAGATGALLNIASGTPTWLAPGSNTQVLTITGGVPTWAASPKATTLIGFSQAQDNTTFNATLTKIAHVQMVLTVTSAVYVSASMDAFCATTNLTYRLFLRRDGVTKTTGPFSMLSSTGNLRNCAATSFVESGLVAGTYNYELWTQNTADNTTISVGDSVISVLAIG